MRSALSQVLFEIFLVLAFAMVFVAGVAIGHAFAQEIPSEETKTWALKRAWQLNGNSMVSGNMIDLSGEVPGSTPVVTEKIKPAVAPMVAVAEAAPAPVKADICLRHGLRRKSTHGGKSWRCAK
jgi:hypothetical protein